jgi:hypothetical protein
MELSHDYVALRFQNTERYPQKKNTEHYLSDLKKIAETAGLCCAFLLIFKILQSYIYVQGKKGKRGNKKDLYKRGQTKLSTQLA